MAGDVMITISVVIIHPEAQVHTGKLGGGEWQSESRFQRDQSQTRGSAQAHTLSQHDDTPSLRLGFPFCAVGEAGPQGSLGVL